MQRNICFSTLSVLALAILLGLAGQANAVITHAGLNDPTTEDWTLLAVGTYAVGPGANDGQDYWPIDASGQETGNYVGYRNDTAQELLNILSGANSWYMSATVKVTSPGPNIHLNEPFFGVRDPNNWWQLSMVDTGVVDTTGVYIQDTSGAEVLVEAVDISAYHTYKMAYDPVADSLDVTVDGASATTFARADVFTHSSSLKQINFGDFNSTAGGSISQWSAVEFGSEDEPLPPPDTFVHVGTNDPASEGWSTLISDGYTAPGTDEMDHWEIASSSPHAYMANGLTNPNAQSIIDSPDGWSLEATVKAVEPTNAINTVMMRVTDNLGDPTAIDMETRGAWGDTWMMHLMTDPAEEPDPAKTGIWSQTMATGDDVVFLTAVDITEYHTYGMTMTRGATMQEDSVEYTLDGVGVGTVTRAEAYNMQYWRSYVPDGWSDCAWGRTTDAGDVSVAHWNAVEFLDKGLAAELPGDANGDGYVDVSDLGILATNYGAGGGFGWGDADFTGDGFVDVSDLGILATNYGTAPEAQSVPEPSSVVLLLGAVALMAFYRRK